MAIYKDQIFSGLIKICVSVHSSVVSDKVQGLSLQRAGTQGPSDPANHYSENSDRYLKQTQLCFGPEPRTGRKEHKEGVWPWRREWMEKGEFYKSDMASFRFWKAETLSKN